MKQSIGFIGLGTMGQPIAERLLHAGFPLVVYNRTESKAESLIAQGARCSTSPADAGNASEVCITMVSDPAALEQVVFGAGGLDHGLSAGKIHIDMSTVSPAIVEKLAKHYASKKIGFLHVPVLGSVTQVNDGTLLLFVGGDESIVERVKEILDAIGARQWCFTEATQATHMKLICNMFIAGMIVPLAQGIVFGKKVGIDPKTLLDVLEESSLRAPMYRIKGDSIIRRKFTPARFYAEHLLKDINLALDAGKKAGVPLPGLEPIRDLYKEAVTLGFSKEDYSSVVKVLEKRSGLKGD